MPGSTSTVIVQQPDLSDPKLFVSDTFRVQTAPPVLLYATPLAPPVAAGNFSVRLEGSLFQLDRARDCLSGSIPSPAVNRFDDSCLWSVAVELSVPDVEGRLGRLPDSRTALITFSNDTMLEFVMPPALGVVNVQLRYSRDGLPSGELEPLLSNAVNISILPPVITRIVTEAPADDPCTLLRNVAAFTPCDEAASTTAPAARTLSLSAALQGCYPASGLDGRQAFTVPPAPGHCDALQLNHTTAAGGSAASDGVAFAVSDGSTGNVACRVEVTGLRGGGGQLRCNATAPACADAAPTCSVTGVVVQPGARGDLTVRVTSADDERLQVCEATVKWVWLPGEGPDASPGYNVSSCNASVGAGGSYVGSATTLAQPCGLPRRRVIGSCGVHEVLDARVEEVLTRCLQPNASLVGEGARNNSAQVFDSEDSTDKQPVSACALAHSLIAGQVQSSRESFLDRVVPSERSLLKAYRANTYCWPRFPLDASDDARYASCVKANVVTRTLSIQGSGFGDRLVRLVASIGNATHRTECKQPEVRSDMEIRCELENTTALPIGDLTAVIQTYGGSDPAASSYYRVDSGNQSATRGPGVAAPSPAVIRSLCRLGTRYVVPNSPYFPRVTASPRPLVLAADNATANATANATVSLNSTNSTALLTSSSSSVSPLGVCVECDATYRAACLGGDGDLARFFTPRAEAAFWRTESDEWLSKRNLLTADVRPDDFVPCAVPELCRANQACVEGTSGFMCTVCASGWARGIDGVCIDCSGDFGPTQSIMLLTCAVLLGVLLLRLAYSASPAVRRGVDPVLEVVTCASWRRARAAAVAAADEAAGRKKKTLPVKTKASPLSSQPQIMIYIKVFLGYSQGLSAINTLLQSSRAAARLSSPQPGDAQIVPNALVAASVFGELGMSTRQVSCVLADWTRKTTDNGNLTKFKARAFMLLPIVLLGVSPLILGAAALARWAVAYAARAKDAVVHGSLRSLVVASNAAAASEGGGSSGGGGAAAGDEPIVLRVNPTRQQPGPAGAAATRGTLSSATEAGVASGATAAAAAPADPTKPPASAGGSLSYAIVLGIYLSLGPSIAAMARLLSCEDEKKGGFLRDDPSQSCFEPDFKDIQSNAIIFGYLYLMVPLLLGLFLALPMPGAVKRKLPVVFLLEAYREYPWPAETPLTWSSFLRQLRTDGLFLPSGWETVRG